MKKIIGISLCAVLFLSYATQAQDVDKEPGCTKVEETTAIPSAKKGQVYGADIAAKNIVKSKDFKKQLHGENPVKMQVKGVVTSVCQARGCWAMVDLGDGNEVFVKMKDYNFFLPTDIKGKEILLSGQAFVDTHSVEELRDAARDQNKSDEEIEKINKPEEELRFTAFGVTVLN
ncbi:MAG TPA: DUF4920 domain-containing protein [Edaphocola sp.]|nr:DUF4920 domain-containing protein [Edaphocola sp.]